MNESQYIHRLAVALQGLEFKEREGILQDYRQHFRDGRENGLSDGAIASGLGMPEAVAQAYLEDWAPPAPPGVLWYRRHLKLFLAGAGVLVLALIILGFQLGQWAAPVPEPPTAPPAPAAPSWSAAVAALEELVGLAQRLDEGTTIQTVGMEGLKQLVSQGVYPGCTDIEIIGNYQLGVFVRPITGSTVSMFTAGSIPKAHDVTITFEKGRLRVQYDDHGIPVSMNADFKPLITLELPAGQYEQLHIETVAGNIRLDAEGESGIDIEDLSLTTVSGDIRAEYHMHESTANLQSVSGDIQALLMGQGESVRAVTVSGSIDMLLWTTSLDAESVSGNISVAVPTGWQIPDFRAESLAGTVRNRLLDGGQVDPNWVIHCETVSGRIELSSWDSLLATISE